MPPAENDPLSGTAPAECAHVSNVPRLVLFSGLAATESVFTPQKLAFPQLVVPAWPIPSPDETLQQYALRLAEGLPAGPCVLGGASFGGMVALDVARHVDALAVVLIGSVESPTQLPVYARVGRCFRWLVPWIPARWMQWMLWPATTAWARRLFPFLSGIIYQFRMSDPRVFKWSLLRILDWQAAPVPPCPVYHIHGTHDYVLPLHWTRADRVVRGGGHVLSITHPTEVNDFIRAVLESPADRSQVADGTARQRPAWQPVNWRRWGSLALGAILGLLPGGVLLWSVVVDRYVPGRVEPDWLVWSLMTLLVAGAFSGALIATRLATRKTSAVPEKNAFPNSNAAGQRTPQD